MRTSLFRKVVVAGPGLIVAAALLTEVLSGTWFSRDPLDRLALQRDLQVTIAAKDLYPGAEDFISRRDHWGFRGTRIDPATVAIVTVGGSATSQPHLPEERTWQAAMARALAEMGREVVIANAGLDGQSTVGTIRGLEEWLPNVPGLKPRFVICPVGIEDAHGADPVIDRLEYASTIEWLRATSVVYRLGRTVAGTVLARGEGERNHGRRAAEPSQSAPGPFRERLKVMARLIHGMGAVPIFVTQARAAEAGGGIDPYGRLEQFNDATRRFCRDEGMVCLDLARELAFTAEDFSDAVRNTPQGAEKIGRWLAAKLAGLV